MGASESVGSKSSTKILYSNGVGFGGNVGLFSREEGLFENGKFKCCLSLLFLQEPVAAAASICRKHEGSSVTVFGRVFNELHVSVILDVFAGIVWNKLDDDAEAQICCYRQQANVLGVRFLEQEQGMQRRRQLKVSMGKHELIFHWTFWWVSAVTDALFF